MSIIRQITKGAALSALLCGTVFAGTPGLKEAKAITPLSGGEKTSRWSISVGAFARSLDADFRIRPQYRITLPSGSARGRDVGLYTSLQQGLVFTYQDGAIGPTVYPEDGDVLIMDAVHVRESGRSYVEAGGEEHVIYDVLFHADVVRNSYTSSGRFNESYGEDDANGVGPEINVRYTLMESGPFGSRINLYAGYGYLQSDHGHAAGLGVIDIYRRSERERFNYRYDAIDGPYYAIIDPEIAGTTSSYYDVPDDIANPFRAPSKSSSKNRSAKRVDRYRAVGSADLDVNFHEIRFAPEIQFDLNERLTVGLIAGPTLNVIDGELTSQVRVYRSGQSKPVSQSTSRSSNTEVVWGAMADLVAVYNVSKDGSLFLEGRLGYHWVQSVDFKAGAASAELDASSLTGSLALGWRF